MYENNDDPWQILSCEFFTRISVVEDGDASGERALFPVVSFLPFPFVDVDAFFQQVFNVIVQFLKEIQGSEPFHFIHTDGKVFQRSSDFFCFCLE